MFVGLALASAVLHAGWNRFVKVVGDRLVAIATISLGSAVTGAVMILLHGVPDRRSWGYLVLTTLFYYGSLWLLHRAYGVGDVRHAYPLVQGAAPSSSRSALRALAASGRRRWPCWAFLSRASES